MKLKNFFMFSFSSLIVLLLAGCKSSAPELSFEETLKIYTEQTSTIKEILNFMNDTGSQIENKIEAETRYSVGDSMKGNLSLSTDIISDNKSKDTEAKISIGLDSDDSNSPENGFYIKSAKVDLNTMMKDFKLYFKLLDFSVDSNQQEYVTMVSELVNGFKNQRLTIEADEFTELMKRGSENQFNLFGYLQSNDSIEEIFEKKELTKYDGYPAWKVSFNDEEIKRLSKEIYEIEQKQSENTNSGSTQEIENFNEMIDKIEIENEEVYFVIHSQDKVDLIIKNMDIITDNEKINIKEKINSKIFGKDSKTIEFTLSNEDNESEEISIIVDLLPGLTSYGFEIRVNESKNGKIQELFNLKGEIKASLSEKTLVLNPNFILESDSISADIKVNFITEKIQDYVFEEPKDAESLDEIIGSLLGGNEEIDDEDYIYDYDESYEENLDLEEIEE